MNAKMCRKNISKHSEGYHGTINQTFYKASFQKIFFNNFILFILYFLYYK